MHKSQVTFLFNRHNIVKDMLYIGNIIVCHWVELQYHFTRAGPHWEFAMKVVLVRS